METKNTQPTNTCVMLYCKYDKVTTVNYKHCYCYSGGTVTIIKQIIKHHENTTPGYNYKQRHNYLIAETITIQQQVTMVTVSTSWRQCCRPFSRGAMLVLV